MTAEEAMKRAHELASKWHISKAAFFGEVGDSSLASAIAAALLDARREALEEARAAIGRVRDAEWNHDRTMGATDAYYAIHGIITRAEPVAPDQASAEATERRETCCGRCGQAGHNRRRCDVTTTTASAPSPQTSSRTRSRPPARSSKGPGAP